jgi:hypothetical protein
MKGADKTEDTAVAVAVAAAAIKVRTVGSGGVLVVAKQ